VLKILASTANKLVVRVTGAQNLFIFQDALTILSENFSRGLKVKMGRAPRSHVRAFARDGIKILNLGRNVG
jgi:hypothetical protein